MTRLLTVGTLLLALGLSASLAVADMEGSRVPPKGTEGPDISLTLEPKGVEVRMSGTCPLPRFRMAKGWPRDKALTTSGAHCERRGLSSALVVFLAAPSCRLAGSRLLLQHFDLCQNALTLPHRYCGRDLVGVRGGVWRCWRVTRSASVSFLVCRVGAPSALLHTPTQIPKRQCLRLRWRVGGEGGPRQLVGTGGRLPLVRRIYASSVMMQVRAAGRILVAGLVIQGVGPIIKDKNTRFSIDASPVPPYSAHTPSSRSTAPDPTPRDGDAVVCATSGLGQPSLFYKRTP